MTPDPLALAAALDRQAAVLAPITQRLQAQRVHPPIAPHDWGGPAARGFDELEQRLRARVADAAELATQALHETRIARGGVSVGGAGGVGG